VLSTFPKATPYGFTLIELMITIAIFSITLTFGVSSYRTWVQSSQIRNAAESIQNGIQRARGEAVKCNTRVAFVLGATTSWKVIYVDDCGDVAASGIPAGSTLESRSSKEGSSNVTVTATPTGAKTITFNNLGTVAANADASATLAQVDFDSTVSAADLRKLRVAIGLGGNARVCDPNLNTSSTDPRRCF
jgi:type IV fimbrial biogenesis protein FimT